MHPKHVRWQGECHRCNGEDKHASPYLTRPEDQQISLLSLGLEHQVNEHVSTVVVTYNHSTHEETRYPPAVMVTSSWSGTIELLSSHPVNHKHTCPEYVDELECRCRDSKCVLEASA